MLVRKDPVQSLLPRPAPRASSSGSVFFAVFAVMAMVGVIAAAVFSFMNGPLRTANNINKHNVAETQMQISAKVAALSATTAQADDGDCDADAFVEPIPYKDAGAGVHPTGGGLLPDTIGSAKMDPWKTNYGYCVWDHGPKIDDAGCGGAPQLRLPGTNSAAWDTLAVISAGPDRTFQTTCNAWADVNADSKPDTPLVDKPTTSDDIVFSWTYAEAGAAAAGLWQLKSTDPTKATIAKDLEVTGGAEFSGALTLTEKGLVLPGDPGDNSITGACDNVTPANAANDQQLRRNTSTSPPTIEICDVATGAWTQVSGAGGGGGGYTERADYRDKFDIGCAIKRDGSMWCWGYNGQGRIGDGTTTNRLSPVQVGAYTDWVKVATANNNTCGIRGNGTLWCWGANGAGQLGDGTTTDRLTPTQVGANTDWTQIDSNWMATCGIRAPGTLWCWGITPLGTYSSPTQVGAATDWTEIKVGETAICGLRSPGTLWCWGQDNSYGQLGDGTTVTHTSPAQVGTETDWTQVSWGELTGYGIRSDGSLWGWGYNDEGEVGDGTTTTRLSPVQIGADTDWSYIGGGTVWGCAIKSDGSLWCWGYNQANAGGSYLGDGTTADQHSPVRVLGGQTWSAVAGDTASTATCAMATNGTLWCWGDQNGNGMLGDGTTTNRPIPTLVSNFVTRKGDLILNNDTDTTTCDSAHAGAVRYNTTAGAAQFCDGTNWQTFVPTNVSMSTPTASDGYFVLSKGTWDGNLGGLTGADAKCLTDLTTNTGWMGYADANARGLLNAGHVFSFVTLFSVGSHNLLPSTKYYFANANDATVGGAFFTTDASGRGPGNTAPWSGHNYFGSSHRYWAGRAADSSTLWIAGGGGFGCCGNNDCSAYSSNSGAISGNSGDPTKNNDNRWGSLYSNETCDTALSLICFVNP